ncbi:hypothetical protein BI347_04190 [Chromobacterium sphagni]|uniref:DUF3592 domain-containing protein n=1 Tax=Chromobacterium sphagni TaxID=1903179 RepID=A0A1S1X0R4_9NEIS|nr:DUF3592 domain-containing protein [Chromobacterium sphagni]OHX12786.1 hypothetical protein BI347_04190 [Chromobacterium sphagni]
MLEKWPAWLLIAIGVAAFAYLWRQARLADAAQGWPSVAGRVESSALDWRQRCGGDNSDAREYRALLAYRYEVAGQRHLSTQRRIPEPGFSSNQALAEQIIQRYPAGATVQVYYNPARPQQACLEIGVHWSVRAGQLIALLFIAAGAMLLRG